MGYVVPECVEDGAWMLWGNYSAVVVVAIVAAVALLKKLHSLQITRHTSKNKTLF